MTITKVKNIQSALGEERVEWSLRMSQGRKIMHIGPKSRLKGDIRKVGVWAKFQYESFMIL